jgi:hypothetical protein
MVRVYVSSTIADLRRERRAVMDWLVAAQHQVVHSYRPDGETVRDSCLEDVDACDLFVLILGHRYGFRPADGNPEGLSITHLEFRRAGQSGRPRVGLLRTSIPDVSLSDMEDPQRAAPVVGFRDEVSREVRPALFHDESSLIAALSTGVQAELEKLGKRPDGVRPAGHRPAGPVLRLAPRPPFLAGREELLAELGTRLASGESIGPRVVVLSGLAGAGKTSVAVEYAHRHLAEAGVVWQLPAEDAAVLAAGFTELAGQLGAGEGWGGDPVAAVHSVLAAYPARWLLVFDNARDRASVARLVPPGGQGQVLITSRNALWPPGQLVEVPVLDVEVAAGFLVARTGDPDRQAAAGLAEAVGGLPLALEQAAAYIQATGDSLAGYLASFQQRRADLLARGEPVGYPGTVAAACVLAFTQLEETAPVAAGLLRLLAFCAPEAVPLGLLLRPQPGLAEQLPAEVAPGLVPLLEDELAVKDAVGALRQYSLVRPAGAGAVSVHRLVQAVTAEQMPELLAGAWRRVAALVIEAAIPIRTWQPDAWPVCAVLLPHARAVLGLTSDGMERIAAYVGYSGSYSAARDLFQLIADAREADHAYGPEHRETLFARGRVAYWTSEAGDAAGARDQVGILLPIVERVLGPEDPETLRIRGNLASFTGRAGDAAGARDQLAALLPIRERMLGPEDRDTLVTRGELAYYTGEAGDAAGARDQVAALLPIRERVRGPEHPDTLSGRRSLARWTGHTGDAAGARDQLAALLSTDERVLGPEHPDTLAVRANLATWTGRAGDAAGARDQLAALLPIRQRVSGPEHPATLSVRHNLARWTGEAGDAAAARDQFAALLPIRERALGPEHPNTLTSRSNLATWTGEAGDAGGARDQLAALLPIRERVLGPEHPNTLSNRRRLAHWTGEAGDAGGARDQFAALLPTDERMLGPARPETLTVRANLANWTGKAGDAAAARDQLTALLPIFEQVLGPQHPSTLVVRRDLTQWTQEAGANPRRRPG